MGLTYGATLPLPNSSFESPETEFVSLQVDSWQKLPKPEWFVETPEQQWDQLVGIFKNTDPGAPDHIDNVDGEQAIYLFAVPQAGFFQDYDSIGGTNAEPTHEFDLQYEPGKSYQITFGVVGGGGNMVEGTSMLASLYYRDEEGNFVTIASTSVVHSASTFPTSTHLVDFTLRTPPVQATDAWAGRHLGMMFASTATPEQAGGYWDLDNIRLESFQEFIPVPNFSFESPDTEFVSLQVDSWQKFPKPDWFVESPEQQWDQLVGIFQNTEAGAPDHIDNVEGGQAIYIFAVPQAGFFQHYTSIGGTNTEPSNEFDATFEPGHAYKLTVGIVGGGGNMAEGATLLAGLYYSDASGNQIPVAATTVTHSAELFPNITHLVDFEIVTPTVQAGDPWAGEQIGIMFVSTAAPELAGGYWDLDNVRLRIVEPAPTLMTAREENDLRISWMTEPNRTYQLYSSDDLETWTPEGPPIAGDGAEVSQAFPLTSDHLFFRLEETLSP